VHPAAELEAKVQEQAVRLTEHAPLTMAAVKEATRRMRDVLALDSAEDIILSCYLSQDFKEGARAFLEKRKPNWTGR
jgi:enoyl-CoA hydratase/carnithine racemase